MSLEPTVHKAQAGAQEAFLSSNVEELFFGGEAGGGKSWALCQEFLYDVDHPKASGILFRRSYPDLEDLIHKALDHFSGFNPKFNESKHTFIFPSGARFRFSHLQRINDIFTHAGQEYHYIAWDEICHFPMMPYLYLFSRNRTTAPELRCRVRATGNPDGEGVLWVKARFVDMLQPYQIGWFKREGDRDIQVSQGTEGCISRQWIPTVRGENVALNSADPQYEAKLDQLPEDKKRAYKFGIWDQFDIPFQVIPTDHWQKAISGHVERKHGVGAVGADYAESCDRCVIVSGRGNAVLRVRELPGMKTTEFAQYVHKEHMLYGRNQCWTGVDSVGPGVGVYHELDRMGIGDRLDACKYKDPDFDARYEKLALKMHFNNWRTQAWWQFREDMEAGDVDLSHLQSASGWFQDLHKLQEEVLAHTYKIQNGICQIIDKNTLRKADHLGRSPDLADALVIWNWMRHFEPFRHRPLRELDRDYNRKKLFTFHQDRTDAVAWT